MVLVFVAITGPSLGPWISALSALASAVAAAVAVCYSIKIHKETRAREKPLERPILTVSKSRVASAETHTPGHRMLGFKASITNVGHHPASLLVCRMFVAPCANPGAAIEAGRSPIELVNPLFPGSVFEWDSFWEIPEETVRAGHVPELTMCMHFTYGDGFVSRAQPLEQWLYYKYTLGGEKLIHLRKDEMGKFQKAVLALSKAPRSPASPEQT